MLPLLHFATPDQMAIKIRKIVNGKKSANFPVGNHRWSTFVLVIFQLAHVPRNLSQAEREITVKLSKSQNDKNVHNIILSVIL
jgi:hypothetical protein